MVQVFAGMRSGCLDDRAADGLVADGGGVRSVVKQRRATWKPHASPVGR